MPKQDAFKELVRLAKKFSKDESLEFESQQEVYDELLTRQSKLLTKLSTLLYEPMVRDSVITGDDFSAAFDKVRYLLNLSTLILVKARVLARSSNYGDAITWCVHALKLATIIRNGGLVTDMLTASTLTKSAIECMRFFRRALTIQSMENLIDELEQHLDQLEPFADILARDQVFEKSMPASDEPFDPNDLPLLDEAECGISHEDQQVFRQMVFEMSQTPDESRHLLHEQTDNMTIALLRLLIVDLKVRLFEDENGYLPDSLLELPDPVPKDPFTDEAFIYRVERDWLDGFVLYSTGPNKDDEGGKFLSYFHVSTGQGDLCLDVFDIDVADNE